MESSSYLCAAGYEADFSDDDATGGYSVGEIGAREPQLPEVWLIMKISSGDILTDQSMSTGIVYDQPCYVEVMFHGRYDLFTSHFHSLTSNIWSTISDDLCYFCSWHWAVISTVKPIRKGISPAA